MKHYDHQLIEKKWQAYWDKEKLFAAHDSGHGEKRYVLDMFPYPSSAGLHVGHPEGYTATDIVSRYLRMKGYRVLHPMGWDAFGLPAENYAIKQGVHPRETTLRNIETFKRQIKSLGFSYDWTREVNTSQPEYYRWTQWLFLQLYKKGLAYKKKAPVNWCDSCQTVLAREQVVDGRCERCKNQVVQKELEQWFFKITDYADRLLSGLDTLDWPEPIKLMQRNWIGRSEGCDVVWKVDGSNIVLSTFTTTVDTIFGVTFAVISPEHPELHELVQDEYRDEVEQYILEASKKTELERLTKEKNKTGVFTGTYLIHPFTGAEIPLWVADYVLMSYGTGVVMGVPAHDQRDQDFALKYHLSIVQSIESEIGEAIVYDIVDKNTVKGRIIGSNDFAGFSIQEGRTKIIERLESTNQGIKRVRYKLRDWLVSRQRYWGAPIPIIYCAKCGEVPVPEDQLPVELPNDVDFRPTGESPLARSKKFHDALCPKCGTKGVGVRRESDTMDTFVDSSWYFLRYTDPKNDTAFASREKIHAWMPVNLYVGGAEHAVLHLLYARFFTKVLHDAGLVDFDEPFMKLRNQGMILAEDGRKMSKSLGNVINPDEVVEKYGADTMRLYEMFMGPLEDAKPWSTTGIIGVRRFLEKIWHLVTHNPPPTTHNDFRVTTDGSPLTRLAHQTIRKVTEDIEVFKFNTAISQLMIFANALAQHTTHPASMAGSRKPLDTLATKVRDNTQHTTDKLLVDSCQLLVILLSPFAPHLAEELWECLGGAPSVNLQPWPQYDPMLTKDETIELVIQVNGKVRDRIEVSADVTEENARTCALTSGKVQKFMDGKKPKKVIFVKGKLVNIVV